MSETGPDQPSGDQKRKNSDGEKRVTFERVISFLNLLILAVTMAAVIWYASEARKQSSLIAQSVEQEVLNSRPIVYENGVSVSERTPDGIPNKVKINFRNFGRSMAETVVSRGRIVVRDAGAPAPVDPFCNEAGELPKSDKVRAIAPDAFTEADWVPPPGEDLSEVSRGEVLYVVGCVYYSGLDRIKTYFSDLCVVWTPKGVRDFESCNDPGRNYLH